MKDVNPFKDQTFRIVTQHHKEKAIAPAFSKRLGVTCLAISTINTDQFGTFCGSVSRNQSPLDTARMKAREGARVMKTRYVLASEGSFGPHPLYPMDACDEELLLLIDSENGYEWYVFRRSINTNFASLEVESEGQLVAFARAAGFPWHGLMLRPCCNHNNHLIKGILSWTHLKYYYRRLKSISEKIRVETDMRALYNPTRMRLIGHAAHDLVSLLLRPCPVCRFPGFAVTEVKYGLPCGWCGTATRSVLSHICTCRCCGFTREKFFPHGKQKEDPMYCSSCNP